MLEVFRDSGPAGLAVLTTTALAAAWVLVLAILPLARLRPPAFLHVAGPAAVLVVGGLGTLYGRSLMHAAVANATEVMQGRLTANGSAEAAAATWLALHGAALVCLVGALGTAVTNVARAEEPRWTPLHAVVALPAALAALPALAASPWAALVVLVGALAMALSALRVGEKEDLRRMASGRALVGALATGAVLCAGSASALWALMEHASAQAGISRDIREAISAATLQDAAWATGGTAAAVLIVGITAVLPLAPVLKGIIDGRASVGLLLAALLGALPLVVVLPGVPPLLTLEVPYPEDFRTAFWERNGIELVEVDSPKEPWFDRGTRVTIATYWLYLSDQRLAPYKEGRLDQKAFDEDGLVGALRRRGRVDLEVDRRADLRRVLPVLRTLAAEDEDLYSRVCLVVRGPGGTPACAYVSSADPSNAPIHVLLESEVTLLIRGETLEPVDRGQLADALREANGQAAVHVRPEISAQRWIDAVVALQQATGKWPILVLD